MEYLTSELLLRVFTLLLWIGALVAYIRYIRATSDHEERQMRWLYSSIIISVIIHAIVFYIALIATNVADSPAFLHWGWSNMLRIHTALALIIHKLLRTKMSKLQDY